VSPDGRLFCSTFHVGQSLALLHYPVHQRYNLEGSSEYSHPIVNSCPLNDLPPIRRYLCYPSSLYPQLVSPCRANKETLHSWKQRHCCNSFLFEARISYFVIGHSTARMASRKRMVCSNRQTVKTLYKTHQRVICGKNLMKDTRQLKSL
jgi:hypothetical protein